MARKLDSGSELGRSAHAARLRIMDWDEGAPQTNGWFGVEITYRQHRGEFDWEDTRSSLRQFVDLPDLDPKRKL